MTNSELAILGLVAEAPRHGYQIEQVIEQRGMRNWTEIGFSSIYHMLKKLERQGLLSSELEEASQGAPRRVFHLTPQGAEALRQEIIKALSNPQTPASLFLLGLSYLPLLGSIEISDALKNYISQLEERRESIVVSAARQRPLPDHVEIMFDYSLSMLEAEYAWVQKLIAKLENGGT